MYKLQTTYKATLKVADSIQLADGSSAPVIDGICSMSEVVSPNGYRYTKDFWPHVLSQQYVKDMIASRSSLGTIEHPKDDEDYLRTPYEIASHVIIDAQLRGNNPYCKFALLNNPKGNSIKALTDLGVPVGVSTRGLGDTLSDSISPYIDKNNYALIICDIVNNPNFADLRMAQLSDSVKKSPIFKELTDAYHLRDSGNTSFSKDNLVSEMIRMRESLQSMISILSVKDEDIQKSEVKLNLENRKIKDSMIRDDYEDLQLTNCVIESLPSNLKVTGTFRIKDSEGELPENLVCSILDIRNCKGIKSLPANLIADKVLAQGSGLVSLPKSAKIGVLNIVNTDIKEVPSGMVIRELRSSPGIIQNGVVAFHFKF